MALFEREERHKIVNVVPVIKKHSRKSRLSKPTIGGRFLAKADGTVPILRLRKCMPPDHSFFVGFSPSQELSKQFAAKFWWPPMQ